MIDGLKPYPAMKDSGVPWLGKVPERWRIERLKSSMSNVIEQTAERRSTELYVALEHVESWTGRVKQAGADVVFDSQVKRFRAGDVLFGKLRPYLAKVARPVSDGVCVGEFLVLRPHVTEVTAAYMEQLLRSKPIIDAINSSTFGAKMPRADWQFVGAMAITLPPLPEQAAIARFLDHAVRRIQRVIHSKQRLMKLLEVQKQTIIHHAVTHGLDPTVRLKPSGMEWMGEVPEHWEVVTVRRVISRAVDGPHHSPNYLDKGIPFLSARNIKSDRWSLDDAKFISENDYEVFSKRVVPEVGDVLYTKGGTTGVARAVDLPFRFQVWVHVAVLKVRREKIAPEYLAMVLNSPRCYEQAQLLTRGATNQDLGLFRMKGIQFALPPLAEQEAILATVAQRTRDAITASVDARREIELLREYRTRLIADVVTGKLDVRDAAARLPDEAEEPQPLDEAEALNEADEDSANDRDPATEEAEA